MKSVAGHYGVEFGKCDASDWIDWDISLTDEEEKAYDRAVKLRLPLEDVPELEPALARAYDDIEFEETENSLEAEDEYTMECAGKCPVDPDEINDLVHSGDAHAIAFFCLGDLSEEELAEWDANDLDELPNVCDFDEDFEPSSPYDSGWILNVEFCDPYEDEDDITEEEVTNTLSELFAEANGDYEEINAYIGRVDDMYCLDFDLCEIAAKIAESLGLSDFSLEQEE